MIGSLIAVCQGISQPLKWTRCRPPSDATFLKGRLLKKMYLDLVNNTSWTITVAKIVTNSLVLTLSTSILNNNLLNKRWKSTLMPCATLDANLGVLKIIFAVDHVFCYGLWD